MDESEQQAELELMLALAKEFQGETDRAAAVLSAAYLDHLLERLIAAAMALEYKQVDGLLYRDGYGPLGTFSAKISVAYCLGLLDRNQRSDLDIIRYVRNRFAHRFTDLTFEHSEIADRCLNLKGAHVGGRPTTARECFEKASIRLMVDINLRIREKQSQSGTNQ
jgi:DNA-binding MltR family transcriptional regulator